MTGWGNRDFNGDGIVDGSDFALIDNAFNQLAATNATPLAMMAGPEQTTPQASFAHRDSIASDVFGSAPIELLGQR